MIQNLKKVRFVTFIVKRNNRPSIVEQIKKQRRIISMPTLIRSRNNISVDINQIAYHIRQKTSSQVSNAQGLKCCICFESQADAVIMECGHGGICYNCSLEMWKQTAECHLCREPISQVVQCDFTFQGRFVKVFSATRAIYTDINFEEQEQEQEQNEQEHEPSTNQRNESEQSQQNVSVLEIDENNA